MNTSIGSYSLKSKTWLWSWANDLLTDSEREKAGVQLPLTAAAGRTRIDRQIARFAVRPAACRLRL